MEKPIEEWSFDDLANYVVRQMFDALITGGAARMRTEFYSCFNVIDQWQKVQKKKNK